MFLPGAIARASIGKAVTTFHEMRAKGRTVAAIARALGLSPEALATLVETKSTETEKDRTRAGISVRDEDRRHRAHRARTRALGKLQNQVETALAKADFSTLPPDKLADLLIRLAEISRESSPPSLSVSVGFSSI